MVNECKPIHLHSVGTKHDFICCLNIFEVNQSQLKSKILCAYLCWLDNSLVEKDALKNKTHLVKLLLLEVSTNFSCLGEQG